MFTKPLLMFDFDGVLMDTFDVAYGVNLINFPDMTPDEYRDLFSGNVYETLNQRAPKPTDVPMTAAEYFDFYEQGVQTRGLIPHMIPVVRALESAHHLSIVTSCTTPIVEKILERSSLASDTFDIRGMEIERDKTKKIYALMEKFDAPPEQCLFITDTVGDILEARAAGVASIAVTWGFHPEARLAAAAPHAIARTPEDIPEIIKNYF